jgi:hypothetical protein
MSVISEVGNKHNRLTVVSRVENVNRKAMWHCLCDCGKEKIVSGTHLRTNHVQSCGCFQAEVVAQIGRSNKGKSEGRGKPRKYENYDGVLGKVVGALNRSEENGAVLYLVECPRCGETHTRNATHLKKERQPQDCKFYKPYNWLGREREDTIMRRQYGISTQQFNELLEFQGHCCAICKESIGKLSRKINIDHDHKTNVVRGILCSGCNTGLGHLGDTVEGLKRALAYLETDSFTQLKYANAR